jgi:epsilon-lactone hydrolase
VPVPKTISPEAQKKLAQPVSDAPVSESLAERRAKTDDWQAKAGEAYRQAYPATVISGTMGGVPVRIVTPPVTGNGKNARVLLNVHGGGFNSDSGSLTETIPLANLTQTKVIAVLYRLAPEHPFPAAVEDTVAVYKELLKSYKPQNIALYGTSAGAILTAETAVRLKQLNLPLPGALGIFSGMGDFSQPDDSQALYGLRGLSGYLQPPVPGVHDPEYVGSTNPKDPVLSPLYADLRGMPPTLFITSGRDLLLSGTTILQRAFLHAGAESQLVVFEALPHAFWNDVDLPESHEADEIMAHFFDTHLGK